MAEAKTSTRVRVYEVYFQGKAPRERKARGMRVRVLEIPAEGPAANIASVKGSALEKLSVYRDVKGARLYERIEIVDTLGYGDMALTTRVDDHKIAPVDHGEV